MQIIQTIREKGAAITVAVIVLCLVGFILMDAKPGSGNNSLSSQSLGKVNGESIDLSTFNKRVNIAELQEQQQSGQRPSGVRANQLRDQIWNTLVAEKIFFKEAAKLGIDFTPTELSSILLSSDPSNPFMQQQGMKDASGNIDIAKAQEALRNIKKLTGEQKDQVNAEIVDPLKLSSLVAKYSGLISASAYYPKWMQEKEAAETKKFADISYVAIPYSDIADSAVKVTDADINVYVKKNKELFKQDAGRTVSYITFSQLPSKEDSANLKAQVEKLKIAFASDSNAQAFVARNASLIDFEDSYLPKSKIQSRQIDTIAKMPAGTVYGPFVENGAMVLAKILGSKQLPDSVKARHILIPTSDPQTGKPVNDDATAKKRADSLFAAIKAGSDFAALAAQFSSDGSKEKGGDLGTFGYGQMVPEFNDFCFNKTVGEKGVVRSQFGYHIIEITNQKNFSSAYKIAFVAKEINASDQTINNASLQATKASAVANRADLEKYVAANGMSMIQNPVSIKENDYSIGAMQEARSLVKWVFEAKKGDISEPFSIGDDFVVAVVDKITAEGVQDATAARSGAEAIVLKEKKAVIIKKKLGLPPTLDAAAAAYNKQVIQAGADSTILFSAQIINGIGVEPKLIGAAFNKANMAKPTPPFAGTSAVYVVKVNAIKALPADAPEMVQQQLSSRLTAIRGKTNSWYEGLQKAATIKDKRSEIF
ncbi:MAG: peptidylprolyl isomerase [Ferruginibacter sp.]